MKWIALLTLCMGLTACTWETYQTQNGKTALRQKYPTGTGIYHTKGEASQNTRYHSNRPQQHAIVPQSRNQ